MLKIIMRLLGFCDHYGWKGFLSLVKKVYWTQDNIPIKNDGYDIISLRKPKHFYFYGTLRQRNKIL